MMEVSVSDDVNRKEESMLVRQMFVIGLAASVTAVVWAQSHDHASPYAGQQGRAVTALSADDQNALAAGQGWGLAKAAELNGVPGPKHLLELAKEIKLSPQQVASLEQLYAEMRTKAIALGKDYVAAERALDDYFRSGKYSDATLREKVDQAQQALANLRFHHLSYHHRTLAVVTPAQVQKYNQLRGYAAVKDDPCAQVPVGHDPEMYRKHMGCQ